MEGYLYAFGVLVVSYIETVQAAVDGPAAMYDALMSPFDWQRNKRHVNRKVDNYFNRLTKDSLVSQLRYDMLDNRTKGFLQEITKASKRRNALRGIFEEFAVGGERIGDKYWSGKQFAAFISSRLGSRGSGDFDTGNASNDRFLADLTRPLWQCFCNHATFPFKDTVSGAEEHRVYLDGWTQALALLIAEGEGWIGRNRSSVLLYTAFYSFEFRRDRSWRHFVNFSIPASGVSSGDAETKKADDNSWRPPSTHADVASVAATQIPIPMIMRDLPHQEILSRVQKLVDSSDCAQISTDGYVISYRELVAIVSVILQVHKAPKPRDADSWPSMATFVNNDTQLAVSKALLLAGGIHEGATVSFADFLAFTERFYSSDPFVGQSFDQGFNELWHALFNFRSRPPSSPSSSKHPPAAILHLIDILYPYDQWTYDRQHRQKSELACRTDVETGLSLDKVLAALTGPFCGSVVVIYGNAMVSESHADAKSEQGTVNDSRPAVFVLLTSSPFWKSYATGESKDFRVGDSHFLFELAPHARVLMYSSPRTQYRSFVSVEDDKLSFGFGNGPSSPSGLSLDFKSGVATMRSAPGDKNGTKSRSGYVEVVVGPNGGKAAEKEKKKAEQKASKKGKDGDKDETMEEDDEEEGGEDSDETEVEDNDDDSDDGDDDEVEEEEEEEEEGGGGGGYKPPKATRVKPATAWQTSMRMQSVEVYSLEEGVFSKLIVRKKGKAGEKAEWKSEGKEKSEE